ncbi:MAG: transposase [Actinobacteria bacterium]|nr:transposase [Actinomycetota bacterium]
MKGRIAELEVKVEELRRKAKRQAAPFSRDERKRNPRRGGRRPGADYGKRARRPAPEEVDEVLGAPAPDRCDCGGEIALDRVAHQYQTELPEVRPMRRRFDVGVGHCRRCGRRHQGRHPLQTSDALGAASSMLGPNAVALATQLNKELGLSPTKTAAMLGQLGIEVTPGGVVGAIARQGRSLGPTYGALCEGVRASGVVAPDETGWRVDAQKGWLWAFVGDGVTVYLIAPGRGYEQAASVLGTDFAGVLERDGWAPYRRFELASHQSCVAHLLRRCSEMICDSRAGQARIPHALRRLLLDALELRDRCRDALARAGEVTEGTAVEITADGGAPLRAGGPALLPGLRAGAEEQAEAAPEATSAAADRGGVEGTPQREPSPLASQPAPAEEVAALSERIEALLGRNPTHRPNQRLLRHLAAERDNLLTFLTTPGVEATNWRAEQAIRPAVVNRKSWGGNRSWRGARTQQVTMSVIRTARQQGVCPIELMAAAQREREPTVTGTLRIPARASPDELPRAA